MEPSSKSDLKMLSSERLNASNAPIHNIPAVTFFSKSVSVPNANGNNVTTIIKNISGLTRSELYRKARIMSLYTRELKTCIAELFISLIEMNPGQGTILNFQGLVGRKHCNATGAAVVRDHLLYDYLSLGIQ